MDLLKRARQHVVSLQATIAFHQSHLGFFPLSQSESHTDASEETERRVVGKSAEERNNRFQHQHHNIHPEDASTSSSSGLDSCDDGSLPPDPDLGKLSTASGRGGVLGVENRSGSSRGTLGRQFPRRGGAAPSGSSSALPSSVPPPPPSSGSTSGYNNLSATSSFSASFPLPSSVPSLVASLPPAIRSIAVGGGSRDSSTSTAAATEHLTLDHSAISSSHCATCRRAFSCCFRWRMRCPVCDVNYCPTCYGLSIFTKACWDKGCRYCSAIVQKQAHFHKKILPVLEFGSSCLLQRDGVLTGVVPGVEAGSSRVQIWLAYDVDRATITWRTLEMRNNCPLEAGELPVGRILRVNEEIYSTGYRVYIYGRTNTEHLLVEFRDESESRKWAEAVKLARELYGPEQQKKEIELSCGDARREVLENRKREREERKQKYLASGMGMRHTAEAMMKASALEKSHKV